jgi:hypothetical protein
MKVLLLCLFLFSWPTPQEAFTKLRALAGRWKMETRGGKLFEEWKVLEEGKLNGRSYKLVGSDTIALEKVLLQLDGTTISYIPTVGGQNNNQPVTFNMSASSDNSFTFENKQHDFPQRVIYRFVNNDSLVARTEGTVNGKLKSSDFYYSRVK